MESKKSILLRIDPALWNELNRWARDDLRSLNGQIEWILRQAVRNRKGKIGRQKLDEAAGEGSERE